MKFKMRKQLLNKLLEGEELILRQLQKKHNSMTIYKKQEFKHKIQLQS
jgi:hypothetical protein